MSSSEKTCKFDDFSWDELIEIVDCYAIAKIERMTIKQIKEFIFDVITENLSYSGHQEVLSNISNDFDEDQVVKIVKRATGKNLEL